MSGDPHIKTFDATMIDLMQFNQIYNMVNAKNAQQELDFVIKMKTTDGNMFHNDPRPGFRNFIVVFPGKNLEIETYDRLAYFRENGKTTKISLPSSNYGSAQIKINYSSGRLEIPAFGIVLEFRSWYGKILIKSGHNYDLQGYCGNQDYDPTNELVIPLSENLYGSTVNVYSANSCNGKKVNGLPFFTCPKVTRSRRELIENYDEVPNNVFCPGSENPEASCREIMNGFPNCTEIAGKSESDEFLATCIVDMCYDDTPEFKKRVGEAFFDMCTDKIVQNSVKLEIPCNFEETITGETPKCLENQIFDGCATECDFMTCEDVMKNEQNFEAPEMCTDSGKKIGGCKCKEGFYLENSVCVPYKVALLVTKYPNYDLLIHF